MHYEDTRDEEGRVEQAWYEYPSCDIKLPISYRIFRNCNVCGRTLLREDEFAAGVCAICANE
jgi:hypothetical protein